MQNKNITADKHSSEMYHAGIVADLLIKKLSKVTDIEVMLATDGESLTAVHRDMDSFKPDVAIDIHTDGFNGQAMGTTVLANSSTWKFAEIVSRRVSAVNPDDPNRGVKNGEQFAFVRYGGIIAELLFHDNAPSMQFYIKHYEDYANALFESILEYLGISAVNNVNVEVEEVKGIIIGLSDGDIANMLQVHNLTGFPITFESAYAKDPFPVKMRIHVGGQDKINTPTDIYCAGSNRTATLIDILKEFHVI
jgi:hypothetical protein